MTLEEYQPLALKTLNRSLTDKQALAMAALGLISEATELWDDWNSEEPIGELGDVTWYFVILCHLLGIPMIRFDVNYSSNRKRSIHEPLLDLSYNIGRVTDAIKKHLYHGHLLDREDLTYYLQEVLREIILLGNNHFKVSLEEIMEHNIAKLAARYPEGFSAEASLHRG